MRLERDGYSVDAAQKKRRPLPDDHWSLNEPPQPKGCEFFYAAFRDLSTCRSTDGPIPWTAWLDYSHDKGLARDVANVLWEVVRQMDLAERRWHVEQMKAGAGG